MSLGNHCTKSTNLVLWFCLLLWSTHKFVRETFLQRFSLVIIFLLFHSRSHHSPPSSVQSQRFRLPDHFGPPQRPTGCWAITCHKLRPSENLVQSHRRLQVWIWYSSVAVSIDRALKIFKWPSQDLFQGTWVQPYHQSPTYSLGEIGISFPLANPLQSQTL